MKPNRIIFALFALLIFFQLIFFSRSTFGVTLAIPGETADREVPVGNMEDIRGREFGLGSPVAIQTTPDSKKIRIRWLMLVANLGGCYLLSLLFYKGSIRVVKGWNPRE